MKVVVSRLRAEYTLVIYFVKGSISSPLFAQCNLGLFKYVDGIIVIIKDVQFQIKEQRVKS